MSNPRTPAEWAQWYADRAMEEAMNSPDPTGQGIADMFLEMIHQAQDQAYNTAVEDAAQLVENYEGTEKDIMAIKIRLLEKK